MSCRCWIVLLLACCISKTASAEPDAELFQAARESLERGVTFYHREVAAHGGYVYRYSADLRKSEGEGKTDRDTVWVQPPGTPAVGLALLTAYERTGSDACLAAAKDAGTALLNGQLRSGGWTDSIRFAPDARAKFAYRVDPPRKKPGFNVSTFDDDKTPAAVRFLMELDRVQKFQDAAVHEAAEFALDAILKAQFPNGGFAQGFDGPIDPQEHPVRKASFPESWPRKYPGGQYWWLYTFNDNNHSRLIETLLLAHEIYRQPCYRDAALKAGDFILLAQLPAPQPAWAQQYDFQMQPAWARKFEPPAITGGESQQLIESLLELYVATGDRKYLAPIAPALEYLQRSILPGGKLARFYELRTNKPLYFTKDYQLTYDDGDVPTHYSFQVGNRLDRLQRRYDELSKLSPDELTKLRNQHPKPPTSESLEPQVRDAIAQQDDRGAWVESGRLRYHGKDDDTDRIIASETFIRNIDRLSRWIELNP